MCPKGQAMNMIYFIRALASLMTLAFALALGVVTASGQSAGAAAQPDRTGRQIYEAACASCHGADGRGTAAVAADYPLAPPDFTDCNFATREGDIDWLAVSHDGGPARGFDRLMPAYGEALTRAEMERAFSHIRRFCTNPAWPRGELNFPRALVTEKAFPEDETVLTIAADKGAVTNKFIYERRFGPRNQIEMIVPLAFSKRAPGDWTGGVGDLAFAFKRTLAHGLRSGSIFSAAAELAVPTGSTERGIGSGTAVLEPFVAYGQILPAGGFLQLQAGGGLPLNREDPDEAFLRTALGQRFRQGVWGRMWSPMLEIIGARELVSGAVAEWDLVPQMQVTLSTRQHIRADAGVRIPVNERAGRSKQFLMYVFWDWFDGGLLAGW